MHLQNSVGLLNDTIMHLFFAYDTVAVPDCVSEAHGRLTLSERSIPRSLLDGHALFCMIMANIALPSLFTPRIFLITLPVHIFDDVHRIGEVEEDAVADEGICFASRLQSLIQVVQSSKSISDGRHNMF